MRFFSFGKKRTPKIAQSGVTLTSREEHSPHTPSHRDLVVYGTSDGARCQQVRSLIARHGYTYQDIRVDEDLSTRSWLQRTTGDNALPKVFIGPKCYGGFEDLQVLIFDGRFDRILRGETDEGSGNDELAALKKEMSAAAISTLMRHGEVLTITEGDMAMDAWAEPLANPPLVYYEGTPHPIEELSSIVEQIMTRHRAGEIAVSWKDEA
jgi:glutaredoxin